ncbi:hypothetical protein JOM56_009885 [Amanita muscaria]
MDLQMPPIERCPREILENIFMECLPPAHEPDRTLMPLQLSHICTRWRAIAFQLPHLWRSLYIVKNPSKPTKYELFCTETKLSGAVNNLRKLAQLWAVNARDHNISVHFEMHTTCQGIGDLLATYANRIRFLRFHILSPYTNVHVFEPFLVSSAVEQLESLHMTWSYASTIQFNTITAFTHACKLRRLRLGFTTSEPGDSRESSFSSYFFMIPWAQLTHVCMDNISVETWNDLVLSCPWLEECLVTFGKFADTFSPIMLAKSTVPHPTTLPYLRNFGINLGHSGGMYSFENLDMPVLEMLQISAKPWSRNERARKFQWRDSLIPSYQWFKHLSSLTVSLQDMSTQVGDLTGILPYAASLKNLSVYYIENGSDVEAILQCLTFTPSECESMEQATLPMLQCLKLEMANTYDLRPATLMPFTLSKFVNCRWWPQECSFMDHPIVRLRECNIGMMFFRKRGAKEFFDEVERIISPFKLQGLRIQVYESHCDWAYDEMTFDWW